MSVSASRELPSGPRVSVSGAAPAEIPLGRYRPLFLLGHGGMGSVEAVAEELADGTTRVVALKRILRSAAGADASRLEMFLREARLTTLLEHPNVIRSLAYGESEGEVFLAMEYVAGEPLSRLIAAASERDAPLTTSVIAFILAEACEGLHAAHELRGADGESLGVVHRDVSPQNVMVGYDGTVKLLDFGVAKIDLADCAARTKTGEVKGKTAYMSPEQAMGDGVDRRSDLYSMGAVLFECVAGHRMWGSGTDFDVLRKLALEEPPKLEAAALDVPAELAALQGKLVARERTKRPPTAHEVAIALRALSGAGAEEGADEVRSTMAQLFAGERERREAALARALASPARERGATPLPELRTAGAGESGPVFVTHQSLAATARPARAARFGAPVIGLAVLAAAVASFVVVRGVQGAGDRPEKTREADRGAAVQPSAPKSDPPVSALSTALHVTTSAPSVPAPPLAANPRAIPTARAPSFLPRTLAAPRLAPSSAFAAPSAPASVVAPPMSSAAPSAKLRSPEPPDVDPTPF